MTLSHSGLRASAQFSDSKPHYELLDGLRGVAALLVLWYHVHEGFAFASGAPLIDSINHGYLAVDFFFILSGFVIGYAYDDRWGSTLTTGSFIKRRLIRLHPMVVMGAVIGLVCFLIQGAEQWDGKAFPRNGPAWSLFFEYIGNIVYALVIRRCSTLVVGILAALLGVALCYMTWTDISGGDCLSVGWTMADNGFLTGSIRMLFPFTMGIFLSRIFRQKRIRGAFWICTVILLVLFAVPYIPSDGAISLNGLYESLCIIAIFPILVWIGASGTTTDRLSSSICKFLGDISFPVYITHYPVMYLFYAWMIKNKTWTLADTWPVAIGVILLNILVAWLCLKLYDEPVRRWLTNRFLHKKKA